MFSTSLTFLPFILPFLSLPVAPLEPSAVSERTAHVQPPVVSPAPRHHRQPASGCEGPEAPVYDSVASGRVNHGRLRGGTFVGESEALRHVDAHGCHFWGTTELTGAVERVAERIAADRSGARLTIGELSKRRGGEIHGHASHENGLDVDLGFYWLDARGRPYEPAGFVDVRPDKTARVDGKTLRFDVARNWEIVEGFLTDPEVDLAIVVVDIRIRRWLLDHARAIGVDPALRRRASIVLRIPNAGAHPHRNHFHLRVFCPESDGACRDRSAPYEWVAEARAAASG